ncbi:condensation domain-containing protein [Streptomyces sp. NPDC001118]
MSTSRRDSKDLIHRILLKNENAFADTPIRPYVRSRSVPASAAQRRLWFIHQLEESNPSYNTPIMLRLHGYLDLSALRLAVNTVISRHEALRTRFAVSEDDVLQIIAPSLEIDIPCTDLEDLPNSEREAELNKQLDSEVNVPFALDSEPLIRARVWRLTQTDYCFLINIHHIVTDGWSEEILLRELGACYSETIKQPRPEISYAASSEEAESKLDYADFALWESERLTKGLYGSQLAYWQDKLSGTPKRIALPFDRQSDRGDTTRMGGWVEVEVPQQVLATLSGPQTSTSLFGTIAAAFAAVLHHWSQASDIVIGTPVANRARSEWESVVGLFVNTVAIRLRLSPQHSLAELLEQVRTTVSEALAHQDVPFDQVVEALRVERNPGINPVYQVMCTVNQAPQVPMLHGLEVTEVQELRTHTAKFDLELKSSYTDAGLRCWIEFPESLFQESTVRRIAQDCTAVLSVLLDDPSTTLEGLPLPPRQQVPRPVASDAVEPQGEGRCHSGGQTETEAKLVAVWTEVLGHARVDTASHFFQAGGNSLLATKLILRIRRDWDITPTVRMVFDAPILRELAREIDALISEARVKELGEIEKEIANLTEEEIDMLLASEEG